MVLLWTAKPSLYRFSTSEFAFVWHLLYLAVGGDIGLFRLAGAVLLSLCGLLFGFAVVQFAAWRLDRRIATVAIPIAAVTATFWEFMQWQPSPNYNELNLAALLLLFSGILLASKDADATESKHLFAASVGPSVLTGVGFALLALCKPTSCIAALVLALAWIALVRPKRAIVCITVSAIAASAVLSVAIVAIDGGFAGFIARNLNGARLLSAQSTGHDLHGVLRSVVHPFLPGQYEKLFLTGLFGAVILALAAASFALGILSRSPREWRRFVPAAAPAIFLGAVIAAWRTIDLRGAPGFTPCHAWYFGLLLPCLAFAAFVLWLRPKAEIGMNRRWFASAAILALVPFSYSIGTDIIVFVHMTAAGVFWVGSAAILAALLPGDLARPALLTLGTNVGTATVGLLVGVVASPSQSSHALWEQNISIALGVENSHLVVDAATAAYVLDIRRAASAAGLRPGTPIIDLSGVGPGLIYALGGNAVGEPWLTNRAANTRAFVGAVLKTVPRAELDRAWILTSIDAYTRQFAPELASVGIRFPNGYFPVGRTSRSDFGWSQQLWKPAGQRGR